MRKVVLFMPAVLATALVATAIAPAKSNQTTLRGACSAKGVDFFFWPQGHPAIPAIGFPAFAPAHLELYKSRDVSNPAQLAYVDARNGGLASSCTAATDTALTLPASAPTEATTQTQKLRCTLDANADIRVTPWKKVTKRFVVRIVKIKGKKKKVRRLVTKTVVVGNVASVGVTGGSGAVAEVRISGVAGTSSSMKWDTRSCTAVDVTG
jgi:hypothetical protein